ncbi:hypothetical protein SSUST3_0664 [Streptococcus suis ST3]|nr:hypothetical protein SSUST3_0664 [Streptococcus suis ST3]
MRRSFYSWLMTQRNPKSNEPVAILADYAFDESDFPKHQIISMKSVVFWRNRPALPFPCLILMRFGKIIWDIDG